MAGNPIIKRSPNLPVGVGIEGKAAHGVDPALKRPADVIKPDDIFTTGRDIGVGDSDTVLTAGAGKDVETGGAADVLREDVGDYLAGDGHVSLSGDFTLSSIFNKIGYFLERGGLEYPPLDVPHVAFGAGKVAADYAYGRTAGGAKSAKGGDEQAAMAGHGGGGDAQGVQRINIAGRLYRAIAINAGVKGDDVVTAENLSYLLFDEEVENLKGVDGDALIDKFLDITGRLYDPAKRPEQKGISAIIGRYYDPGRKARWLKFLEEMNAVGWLLRGLFEGSGGRLRYLDIRTLKNLRRLLIANGAYVKGLSNETDFERRIPQAVHSSLSGLTVLLSLDDDKAARAAETLAASFKRVKYSELGGGDLEPLTFDTITSIVDGLFTLADSIVRSTGEIDPLSEEGISRRLGISLNFSGVDDASSVLKVLAEAAKIFSVLRSVGAEAVLKMSRREFNEIRKKMLGAKPAHVERLARMMSGAEASEQRYKDVAQLIHDIFLKPDGIEMLFARWEREERSRLPTVGFEEVHADGAAKTGKVTGAQPLVSKAAGVFVQSPHETGQPTQQFGTADLTAVLSTSIVVEDGRSPLQMAVDELSGLIAGGGEASEAGLFTILLRGIIEQLRTDGIRGGIKGLQLGVGERYDALRAMRDLNIAVTAVIGDIFKGQGAANLNSEEAAEKGRRNITVKIGKRPPERGYHIVVLDTLEASSDDPPSLIAAARESIAAGGYLLVKSGFLDIYTEMLGGNESAWELLHIVRNDGSSDTSLQPESPLQTGGVAIFRRLSSPGGDSL